MILLLSVAFAQECTEVLEAPAVATRAGFLRLAVPGDADPACLARRLALDEPSEVRQATARALAANPGIAAHAYLHLVATEVDPLVRAGLVSGLGQVQGSRATLEELALSDSSPEVRFEAVNQLGADSQATLEKAARDADVRVRAQAVRRLGLVGAPAQLMVPALSDAAPEVRLQGVLALQRAGEGARPEVKALAADPDPRVAAAAAR